MRKKETQRDRKRLRETDRECVRFIKYNTYIIGNTLYSYLVVSV